MTIFALHSPEASLVLEQSGDALLWRHLGLPVETTGLPPLASTRGAATFSLDEDVPFATAPGLGWFGPLAVSVAGRVLRWAVTDVAADAVAMVARVDRLAAMVARVAQAVRVLTAQQALRA